VSNRVNPSMKAVQPAGPSAATHLVLGEPERIKLARADHAVLTLSQPDDANGGVSGAFLGYTTSKSPLARTSPRT
jgi:hypothetical protein